ncbi:cytochrome P450 3A24 isoform X1 [Biomphalaria glabrata]|nr:cytochrome P450 3A24 isoform X1 [Biomphalaria glabrata]
MLNLLQSWLPCCMSSVSSYLLSLVLLLVTYFLYSYLTTRKSWESYGVKQVSLGKLALTDFRQAVVQLIESHGDTIGIHRGRMTLLTRDLDLLKHVLVKDFNNFVNRLPIMTTTSALETGVFFLNDYDWKRVRHVITPSFTTTKLKQVASNIEESARKLTNVLEEYAKKGDLVPIKYIAGQFTSEVIARSAFGFKTDCIGKEDDEFTGHAKKMLRIRGAMMSVVMRIMFQFKWIQNFLVKKVGITLLDQADPDSDRYFDTILRRTVAERQELSSLGKPMPNDLLQSLISAKEEGDREAASFSGHADGVTWEKLPKTMSERELIGQSMLIIFAGFETTATTLQLALYLLAQHPDIQEKVYQEILETVHSDTPTYEELGHLKYMEQVINETLRLYPPAPISSRVAADTYHYKNIVIPKGASIIIAKDAIMRDPKNFPEPSKFDHERFSEENKSSRDLMTFLPFGHGPRQCIGMRLAYLELKLGLVHVLRKIKFVLSERTHPKVGEELKTRFQGIIITDKPIQLEVHLRQAI